jgi:hypothetical protein
MAQKSKTSVKNTKMKPPKRRQGESEQEYQKRLTEFNRNAAMEDAGCGPDDTTTHTGDCSGTHH